MTQTMLKRHDTLKMLEGDLPMEIGAETRRYGSTKREREEEREWKLRKERVLKGRLMLEKRMMMQALEATGY